MEQHVAAIVARQEFFTCSGWDIDQRLRVGQERAVATDRHGHKHAAVFRHPVGDQRRIQRLLRTVHPNQVPAEVANRQRVVVLHAERAGIVQRPVAHQSHDGHAQRRADGQCLHGVHPADAAGAAKHARPAHRRVLHDFKLGVFAIRHDELAIHFAVGDQLAHVLHHRVVRTDGISRDHVHVGQFAGDCNGFRSRNQGFLFVNFLSLDRHCQVAIAISFSRLQLFRAISRAWGTCSSYWPR